MDKKLKAKWLKALRSGRYKQGKATLKCDGLYCCLGVLANIQGAKWKEDKIYGHLDPYIDGQNASRGGMAYLIPTFSGGLRYDIQKKLAAMNDGIGEFRDDKRNFKEIAGYIESNL